MRPLTPFAIDRKLLVAMTDARTFHRGESYFMEGRVGMILENGGAIEAHVRGTSQYRARLRQEEGTLRYSCTCPLGEDEIFRKHCVALGLAWIGDFQDDSLEKPRARTRPAITLEEVRKHLASQEKGVLAEMLIEQALDDDRLMRRLLLETAKGNVNGPDTETYRQVIDEAVRTDGFVHYRDAWQYAHGIENAIDGIETLLQEGHAALVIDLTEYALSEVAQAMQSIDDSDGNMRPILERLQDLHHQACGKARPDPKELARRLFRWELNSEWPPVSG
jgi:uncharacterized Zn finger protein